MKGVFFVQLPSPKEDIVFQTLFQKGNEKITIALLEAITKQKINSISLDVNKNTHKDFIKQKTGILDFKAIINGNQICNMEIQLRHNKDDLSRFLYYWANTFSSQLTVGEDYNRLKKTISIIIIDFPFKKTRKYSEIASKWRIIEEKHKKTILTNLFEIYIIEIGKAKEVLKRDCNNKLAKWMMFFDNPNTKEVEEIMKTEQEVEEAYNKLKEICADKELYELVQARKLYEIERATEKANAINAIKRSRKKRQKRTGE